MKNLMLALTAFASFGAMADCESGHWISDVMDNGGLIKLEDNSIWQVDSSETADSMIWLITDNVVICSNGKMINTSESTGNIVHARQLTRE